MSFIYYFFINTIFMIGNLFVLLYATSNWGSK